jgi:hypothetical protein
LPPLDLGETSFLDGEAGQGLLLEVIGAGAVAGDFTDASGHALAGRRQLWSSSVTVHPAYVSNLPVLGGRLGADVLIPLVAVHLDVPGAPATTRGGVGDISSSLFVQWSDDKLLGRPFSMRLALQGVAPTGSYAQNRLINTGQNAWQVSPYWAFTWRVTSGWEVSGRAIYDWSSRNAKPAAALDAASSQAGDSFAMNLSASYALSQSWRLGVAGYALRQISDSSLDGRPVAGSLAQEFGLGPGLQWTNKNVTIIANGYLELATKNRPEGVSTVLRIQHPF